MKYVYFVRVADMVKIGCSSDPQMRTANKSEWSPYPIVIDFQIEGSFQLESAIHAIFSDEWRHHEWFKATPRLEKFMDSLKSGDLSVLPKLGARLEDKMRSTLAKKKLTRMVSKAEQIRFPGMSWQALYAIRPLAVKEAMESYAGASVVLPPDKAVEVITNYTESLYAEADRIRRFRIAREIGRMEAEKRA